jgi:CDP-2,3-bis-(O-geranylgeranyl)-sn-glycerol synthase
MEFVLAVKLLLLLMAANGAPILARFLLGNRWEYPIDAGRRFSDGQPLLGPSKTWRGIVCALAFTPLVAWLLYLPPGIGFIIATTAMAGDLLSSFTKRRLRVEPSGMALGLDQIPESLLPLLAVRTHFALGSAEILLLTLAFLVLELVLSRILYRLHIRKQPY